MAGPGGVNMEQFELFFQKADLDRDGRISGAEAVGFFQGANLTKQVLAQIWMHADQNRTGYLSRPEFYNALKLVTVAQSKRELTPDIVKAALHGQASARIPAPQINLAAIAAPPPNAMGGAPSPQTGAPTRPTSQNLGFRGQTPPSTGVNPQFRPAPPTTMLPASSGMNQQFRQVQPSGNQQFGQFPSSNMGMNRQFGQVQSSSTGVNQQFGQVQPSTTGVNQHFGQAPSVTNMNQQFGMAPSSTTMNQQFFPSQGNQSMRPPQSMPTGTGSQPPLNAGSPNVPRVANVVGAGLANSNNDRFGGQSGPSFTGPGTQVSNRGLTPSTPPVASAFSPSAAKDPKAFVGSGNGSSLDPMFGGDVFSANRSSSLQVSSAPQHPANNMATSSAIVPVTSAPQPSNKPDPFEVLQSSVMKPSTGVQTSQASSLQKYNQQVPNQVASTVSSSGVPAGVGNPTTEQPQSPWPKMTRASIQKYAKVFMEVDTDRDGKITGEQARHLFLSWRLPREVLKQVWDLSDQDSDSMLSLREFCIALYLMERYREGRPLPSTLPNSVMLDETLLSLAGPPTAHGSMGWGSTTGLRPQQPLTHAGARPPMQLPQPDGSRQINQHFPSGPVIDNSNSNQLSNGQETPLETKGQEAAETNENVLLDSREKLEFYRTKMQDLVLYKSRCDNRLNEITERARADKGEAELLEKKYQEKYKQVAELHSKLTIEEHTFREIQERKTELHQAIIKMEQGGSADGILQVRADRIQSDLEELLKILTERCKKHALDMKSSAIIELPQGWQPGIQELAAIWDEDWDKFEDEGFSFDVAVPANSKTASVEKENSSATPGFSPDSVSNADATSENLFSTGASAFDTESVYSADYSKSPRYESPSQEYSENNFRKSPDGDAETHRSFDDSTWGNFDNNDDIDSVWGFSAKESEHGKDEDKYFFGSNDFGASPERTDSPRAHGAFEKNSPFTFEDSIPETPLSRTSNSPPRYSMESKDPFSSDTFARYESFGVQDRGSSPTRANLTRFDSINSTTSYDHSRGYSFDDSDPFGSSGPFKVSSETPKKGSDNWNSF